MIDIQSIDVHSLPSVALESRSELPNKSAIYFAIDSQNNIQYIGRSVNLKQRWYGHHRLSQFDTIGNIRIAYLFMDEDLLESVEVALIEWFKPLLNNSITGNSSSNTLDTTTIRIRVTAKKHLDQLAKRDRRSILDTLDLLLEKAVKKSGSRIESIESEAENVAA